MNLKIITTNRESARSEPRSKKERKRKEEITSISSATSEPPSLLRRVIPRCLWWVVVHRPTHILSLPIWSRRHRHDRRISVSWTGSRWVLIVRGIGVPCRVEHHSVALLGDCCRPGWSRRSRSLNLLKRLVGLHRLRDVVVCWPVGHGRWASDVWRRWGMEDAAVRLHRSVLRMGYRSVWERVRLVVRLLLRVGVGLEGSCMDSLRNLRQRSS